RQRGSSSRRPGCGSSRRTCVNWALTGDPVGTPAAARSVWSSSPRWPRSSPRSAPTTPRTPGGTTRTHCSARPTGSPSTTPRSSATRSVPEHPRGPRGLGVGLGEAGHGRMGVEAAGVGHDPQPGPAEGAGLLADLGGRDAERGAVRGDPGEGDHLWTVLVHEGEQLTAAGAPLLLAQLVGSGGGPGDQVGQPDPALAQVGPVL